MRYKIKLIEEHHRRMPLLKALTPGHWYHSYDTATHCQIVIDKADQLATEWADAIDGDVLRYAAMAHDWGKLETWSPDGSPWYPNHENKSADILEEIFETLTLGTNAPFHEAITTLVRHHGRCQQIDRMGQKAVNRLLKKLGGKHGYLLEYFLLLVADCHGFSEEGAKAGYAQAMLFAEAAGLNAEYSALDELLNWETCPRLP